MIGFILTIWPYLTAYIFLCGMVYPIVHTQIVRRCPYGRHPNGENYKGGDRVYIDDKEWHRNDAVAYSLLGPVVVPFLAGYKINSLLTPSTRAEKKREKELTAVKHKTRLAEEEAKQLAVMEKSLREGESD